MVLEIPAVQKILIDKVITKFNTRLDGEISIGKIGIRPLNAFYIEDLLILDNNSPADIDTFFYAGKVSGTFSILGLFKKEGVHIGKARVENGVFHLVIEKKGVGYSNLNRIFGITPPEAPPKGNENEIFDIRTVRVRNFRYRMTNLWNEKAHNGTGINWNDLNVVADEVDGWMKFSHSTMFFRVDHLAMHEKSGYVGTHLSGHGEVGHGRTIVRDFHLEDLWSVADFPEYSMTYGNCIRMRDFVNNVVLETYIAESNLNLKTISYFTGIPFNDKVTLHLKEGHQKGTINNMGLDYFRFTDEADGISGNVSGLVTGITGGPGAMHAKLNLDGISFSTSGLRQVLSKYGIQADIDRFAPQETFNLNFNLEGPLNRLKCTAELESGSSGNLTAKALIDNLTNRDGKQISGVIQTDSLHIGKIFGIEELGHCTMSLGGGATLGKKGQKPEIAVDSLRIKEIRALGYTYSGIAGLGSYDGNLLNCKLISSDPNLNFLMQGNINTSRTTTNTLTKFYLNLGNADLAAINIDKRGSVSKVSFIASGQFTSISDKNMVGDMNIEEISLEDGSGVHHLGDITMFSSANDNTNRIRIKSSLADCSYTGDKNIIQLFSDIAAATAGKSLPALFRKSKANGIQGDFGFADLDVNLKDTRVLCDYVMPGLYISNGTHLSIDMDRNGTFNGGLESQRFAIKGNYAKNLSIKANNDGGTLNALLGGKEFKFNNIVIKEGELTACAQENTTDIQLHYDEANIAHSTGDIGLSVELLRNDADSLGFVINTKPSLIRFNDFYWAMDESEILLEDGTLTIDKFNLHSSEQSIQASGRVSGQASDSLTLAIRNFDLKLADQTLLGGLGLNGLLNANVRLGPRSAKKKTDISGDVSVEDLAVGDNRVGSIFANGKWNNRTGRIELDINSDLDGKRPLIAKGSISPSTGDIDVRTYFDDFSIASVRPFVSSIFSEMSGSIKGGIHILGSLDSPEISSSGTRLNNTRLRLAFTDVAYNLNGPFTVNNSGVRLDNVKITDDEIGSGILNGGILYDRMKNPRLDATIKAANLAALKIAEKASGLYGKVYTNLDLHVSGPFNNITVEGSAGTARSGNIHIPLGSAVASTSSDILTFSDFHEVEPDEFEEHVSEIKKRLSKSGINLKMKVKADRNTEICIDVNKSTGNYATINGNGLVGVDMKSATGTLSLAGDYEITDGKYHFSIPGIVNKDFIVNPGSSVKLNGDVLKSDINLSAIYRVKTSLSTLLADTTTVSSRRPVDCIINISGNLTQPKIGFGVEVKDLDPTTKSRVDAALNTEDKVQKQFVALLVMGMFLPDEQSNINNGTNIIYSNVSQVVSNQLNTIMQRLNIPVDLGLGYQQNMGNNIFDVAISTQLFNNRVVVNGSVGNKKLSSGSGPASDVVGDIDIEVKIDKPGNLRLKMFSHSADQYTSFLDYSQRNGIGISYQKEYSNFFDMIRNIFCSKARREAKEKEKSEKVKEMKIIEIK